MAQEIIIQTSNSKYAAMIIDLAKKLGLKLTINSKTSKAAKKNADLEKIIRHGGDMSYINDPMEWQRNIRKDRNIF